MKTKYGDLEDLKYEDLLWEPEIEIELKDLNHSQSVLLPWCPLFGELPFCNYSSSSQIRKCIDIIEEARDMWDAFFPTCQPELEDLVGCDSWVESDELSPHYPKDELLLARNIFIHLESMMVYVNRFTTHEIPYGYRDFEFDGRTTRLPTYVSNVLSEVPESLLLHWFLEEHRDNKFKNLKGWHIFSILAIYEARKILNLTLYTHVPSIYYCKVKWPDIEEYENNLEIIRQVQVASSLLHRANQSDYNLGRKRRKDSKKFALIGIKEKRRGIERNRNEWLSVAEKLREKHSDWSVRNIATVVCSKLQLPKKRFQSVYKYLLEKSV